MILLSPSLLTSFLYWRDTEFDNPAWEDRALEDLIASIKGEPREPSDAMLLGRAWHEALEMPLPVEGDTVEITTEGRVFRFPRSDVRVMKAQVPEDATRELRGTLELPELDVVIHGRVDAIHGVTIHEHKTASRVKVDKYLGSYQWRVYLLMFHCRQLVYHIARLYTSKSSGLTEVKEYFPLRVYGYDAMRDDVVREVRNLLWFMEDRDLTQYRETNNATGE